MVKWFGGIIRFLWIITVSLDHCFFPLCGLADPQKATVALFSTMNSQFTGVLTRLLIISLLHCFHTDIASYGV